MTKILLFTVLVFGSGCTDTNSESHSRFSTEHVEQARSSIAGQWSTTATSLSVNRGLFTSELRAIFLTDARVMLAGGSNGTMSSAVDIFTDGAFSIGTSLTTARSMSGNVSLADGGALVAGGGIKTTSVTAYSSAERWDPTTEMWDPLSMNVARFALTATRMDDDRVLILGGIDNSGAAVTSGEIFDPTDNTFTPTTGSMSRARFGHVVSPLPDGRLVVIGGANFVNMPPRAIEIFNPSTGTFTTGSNMKEIFRIAHAGARLSDGKILYCGGCPDGTCEADAETSCELFTPNTSNGTIATTGSLNIGGGALSMITLPTGKVLAVGGITNEAALSRAEIFDPSTGTWTPTGSMSTERYDASIALLPDGKVLVAGGRQGAQTTAVYLSSAEIYDPGIPTVCTVCQIDGTCVALANNTLCDDGNACTQTDLCMAGVCVGSNEITCTAQDECHEMGECNTDNGECSTPSKPDGSTCSIGECEEGVCTTENATTSDSSSTSSSTSGAGGGMGSSSTTTSSENTESSTSTSTNSSSTNSMSVSDVSDSTASFSTTNTSEVSNSSASEGERFTNSNSESEKSNNSSGGCHFVHPSSQNASSNLVFLYTIGFAAYLRQRHRSKR